MIDAFEDRNRLDGRVAIVTGGGTGLGRTTALLLAARGAHVVIAGRRIELLDGVIEEIEGIGRTAVAVRADVTAPADCSCVVDSALHRFGAVDVLVNNAGKAMIKKLEEWTAEEWQANLHTNLSSVWEMSRLAAAHMSERGRGSIVNISSTTSLTGYHPALPYSAAKAGVNNLTVSLAAAWRAHGIRVNAVAPGPIASDRIRMDVAHAVLFFATDSSNHCSGQTLVVDGGPTG